MDNQQFEEDFLEQVNAHIRILYKISAVYFVSASDREDAVQDMLYQLWRAYPAFQGRSSFSTWMFRVGLNTVLTTRKRHERLPRSETVAELPDRQDESIDLAMKEQVEWLYGAIRKLGEVDRAIILLYLEEYSYEEIGSITGLTRSNVSVRIVRIKKALEAQSKSSKTTRL